jgi:hypothetical protein
MKGIPCRKSNCQSYQCQVCVKAPFDEYRDSGSKKEMIAFDACLAKELFYLWDNGIKTIGSCCGGHIDCDESRGYIQVADKDIKKMEKLGYKHQKNQYNFNNIFQLKNL